LNPDANTELFRHETIAVTRSWIIVDGVQHAVRYVDQTSTESIEPPRNHALMVLFVCLVLAILTILRIVSEDFSMALGWVILVACAIVILIAGHIAFMSKGQYRVSVRFKNGESITVNTSNASRAGQFQSAISDALDQLDYHDTDQARPTVVLASLEPSQLTAIGGQSPEVVKISDDTIDDLWDEAEASEKDEGRD